MGSSEWRWAIVSGCTTMCSSGDAAQGASCEVQPGLWMKIRCS